MAVVTIVQVAVPIGAYNLTDSADFATLVAGAGNGVDCIFDSKDVIVLKNDTGGPAVFTMKTGAIPASYTAFGVTATDQTIAVAAGKTHLFKMDVHHRNPTSGKVTIECDIAGKALVLAG